MPASSLLDLVPPPSPIVPLAQRGAFTPSMGGSSSRALLGPPIEVVILYVHPLLSGPSSPLFDIANGWVYPGLLRFVFTPRGRHRLVSIQSIKPPHHSLCEPLILAASLSWAVNPTSSSPDSNLLLLTGAYIPLLHNLCMLHA